MCKMTQLVGSQNAKGRCKCGQSTNLGALGSKIRCESYSRRTEYGNLFGGKDSNSDLTVDSPL
jgi:hypothetical protein